MLDRQTELPTDFETHKCPVCNGFGTLKFGAITCHACKGKGFVVISRKTGLIVERQTDELYQNTE